MGKAFSAIHPIFIFGLLGFAFVQALDLYRTNPMAFTLSFLALVVLIVAVAGTGLLCVLIEDYKRARHDKENWPTMEKND